MGEAVSLERQSERHLVSSKMGIDRRALIEKLSFCIVELRLHMNKLLSLRLALSELGCTQRAWNEIHTFKDHAAASLQRLESDA